MLKRFKNIVLFFCYWGVPLTCFSQSPGTKIYNLGGEYQEPPRINTLYQLSQGYILVGTTKGLFKFDGNNFTEFDNAETIPDTVTAICELPDKKILVGFSNGMIGEVKNNQIISHPFEEGFPKVAITKIITDRNDVVWLSTAGEGLYFYKNKKLYNIDTADGLSDNFVYDISVLPSNNVIASTDQGINICASNEKKKVTKYFTSRNGLPDNIVRCLFVTGDENIWLGMQDGGISKYNISGTDTPPKIDWEYGQVNAIIVVNSLVFAATEENGLLVFNKAEDGKLSHVQYKDDQLKKASCLLRDHEGNI